MSNDPISSLEQSILAAVGDNDQVKQTFSNWRIAHAGKTIKVQRPITREEADRLARLIESGMSPTYAIRALGLPGQGVQRKRSNFLG
ncbi:MULTISPECIES: hypothetical protein [Methylococcus]|uniref:hypothetical protein n=1 Tax=Methylococcus TaxID=413 RepID=UPI001C531E24|nr:hypothetical protein [Methylococcus capsulatus]QXP94362.1 hypothetical protein KW113_03955 [Methylococcus capsulatus]